MLPFLYGLLLFLLQSTQVLITYHSQQFSVLKTTNITSTNFQTTPTSQILIHAYSMDISYLRPLDKPFYQCKIIPELYFYQQMTNKPSHYFFKKLHSRSSRKTPILNQISHQSVNRPNLYLPIISLIQISFKQPILTIFNALSYEPTNAYPSNEATNNSKQHLKGSTNIPISLVDLFLSTLQHENCIFTTLTKPSTSYNTLNNVRTEPLVPNKYFYKSASILLLHSSTFFFNKDASNLFKTRKSHVLLLEPRNYISLKKLLNQHNQLRDLLTTILNILLYITLTIFSIIRLTNKESHNLSTYKKSSILLLITDPLQDQISYKLSSIHTTYSSTSLHNVEASLQDSQDQDTNHPTQLIPLLQDCMIFTCCFACFVFLLNDFCNLIYESNGLFNLLTYYSYCTSSTLTSIRYTTNTLALYNTETEHHLTTHAMNTTYQHVTDIN